MLDQTGSCPRCSCKMEHRLGVHTCPGCAYSVDSVPPDAPVVAQPTGVLPHQVVVGAQPDSQIELKPTDQNESWYPRLVARQATSSSVAAQTKILLIMHLVCYGLCLLFILAVCLGIRALIDDVDTPDAEQNAAALGVISFAVMTGWGASIWIHWCAFYRQAAWAAWLSGALIVTWLLLITYSVISSFVKAGHASDPAEYTLEDALGNLVVWIVFLVIAGWHFNLLLLSYRASAGEPVQQDMR